MSTEATKTDVGSYFISNYPPFSQWKKELLPDVVDVMAQPPRPDVPLGLYLHIPFCRKRCKFWDLPERRKALFRPTGLQVI